MPPEPSTITAIEPQARDPERVSVFVDGSFALGMHVSVAAAAGLRVGRRVTVEQLQSLARQEELRGARDSALRLLGYRARSRVELQRSLAQKGFEPELIESALASLERGGLINDAEFSQSWVRARTGARPFGRDRIAAELRQKGVERALVEQALEPLDEERELDLALAVGRRKVEQLRGEDLATARRKLGAILRRRGFPWEVCARAMDILLQADDSDE